MARITQRPCTVELCVRIQGATARKGLCHMHSNRQRLEGSVGSPYPRHNPAGTICDVEGCKRKPELKRKCRLHYSRFKRSGDKTLSAPLQVKHGYYGTPTYRSWSAMKSRCMNPNSTKWNKYGGAGISVCREWSDFSAFVNDMGERPDGTTLDRIDGNGNYEPSNCRWATPTSQAYNTRRRESIQMRGVNVGRDGRIRVEISKFTTTISIGSFDCNEEAAWMYDQWALALYGDMAILNFDYR